MSLLFSYTYNISSKRVICYLAIWPTLIQIRHLYCNENTNNNMPNCEHAHHCPFSIIYVWCLVCCCYCCFFHFFLHFFRCSVVIILIWYCCLCHRPLRVWISGSFEEIPWYDIRALWLTRKQCNQQWIHIFTRISFNFRSYDGHFFLSFSCDRTISITKTGISNMVLISVDSSYSSRIIGFFSRRIDIQK